MPEPGLCFPESRMTPAGSYLIANGHLDMGEAQGKSHQELAIN